MIRNLFRPSIITPEASPEQQTEKPTLDAAEESQIRLGLEKSLFSHTGDSVPIVAAGSGGPFHNLQFKGEVFEHNDVVLEDGPSGTIHAVIVRKYATAGNVFTIYSTRPVYTDETPANLFKYGQKLYAYAEIKQCDKAVLNVMMEGESNPTYTIHKIVPHPARQFPTRHVIKDKDGESVASTRYEAEGGNSFILTVDAGVDPSLMICLATVADEVDREHGT